MNSCASLSHNENVEVFVPTISIGTVVSVTGIYFLVRGIKKNKENKALTLQHQIENERLEEQRIQEEAKQQIERRASEVRGTIQLYSDYTGSVLINGEETQFTVIEENEVMIIIEKAVGNEYTLAVRDSAGIVRQASSRILIESSRSYSASIINPSPSPNAPIDFDVIQNANGITITSYKGTRKRVVIPDTLYGQSVTAIGDRAFRAKGIESAVIPNSVVTIGDSAFSGMALNRSETSNIINEIIIPNSVTTIGSDAFRSCGLTKVTIGRGVRFVGGNAFSGNNISELIILTPLTEYDRRVTGWSYGSNDYSQTLGLHPWVFGYERERRLQSFTRVTLPTNIHDGNLEAFPEGLVGFYKSQGKRAGTYILNGPVWTRE